MTRAMDPSARAGLLLGAFNTGLSYQPSLLSRATRDQAILSGVGAVVGYGWAATHHSVVTALARKLTGARDSQPTNPVVAMALEAATIAGGAALLRALPAQERQAPRHALGRLAGIGLVAGGAAGIGGELLGLGAGRRGNGLVTLLAACGTAAGAVALTQPRKARSGAQDAPEGAPHEDVNRKVDVPKSVASSVAVAALLVALGKGESAMSSGTARLAARALGGDPDDHQMLGRLTAAAITAGAGWGAVTLACTLLARGGEGVEPAHAIPPAIPEVTGGPGSLSSWADQSRESRRWLSMVLTPDLIQDVMGEPAKQPIRVYGALKAADSPLDRAELLLGEIDRTNALERSVFVLFSPTGSGYVNYVASETLEYLTRGDCASACIQYSVLPSALSLTKVPYATDQTRIVVNGIIARLRDMPAKKRPKFFLFGESLGAQVSQEMFRGQGMTGPAGIGLDAAVWVGTPAATVWRQQLWGDRTVSQAPPIGPGSAFLPRAIRDWTNLPQAQRKQVNYLLLENGDDPIPKFGAPVLWNRPDWLCANDQRPPGAPRGTHWMPIVTFFATFLDMQNALSPTPGTFQEGGHDYRREIPEALRTVYRLSATDEQMERVQAALRARELEWETRRQWMAAESKPATDRAAAEAKVEKHVAEWTGESADAARVESIAFGSPVKPVADSS